MELVIERFGEFARSRNIAVVNEIDRGLDSPKMPVAVYSGSRSPPCRLASSPSHCAFHLVRGLSLTSLRN